MHKRRSKPYGHTRRNPEIGEQKAKSVSSRRKKRKKRIVLIYAHAVDSSSSDLCCLQIVVLLDRSITSRVFAFQHAGGCMADPRGIGEREHATSTQPSMHLSTPSFDSFRDRSNSAHVKIQTECPRLHHWTWVLEARVHSTPWLLADRSTHDPVCGNLECWISDSVECQEPGRQKVWYGSRMLIAANRLHDHRSKRRVW